MADQGTTAALDSGLAEKLRTVLEFHRWSGTAEGVTGGATVYRGYNRALRDDSHRLQRLCELVENSLRGSLPSRAATDFAAGRMYRRAADYVKAGEYFLRALETVYRERG